MNPTERLLDLISYCRSRHNGVTLNFIMDHYSISKRTAQRMTSQLEYIFPNCIIEFEDDGRKIWKLRQTGYDPLLTLTSDDLATLDLAGQSLKINEDKDLCHRFDALQNKLKAHIPEPEMLKIEPDLDALLISQGFAFRPFPVENINIEVTRKLTEAIKRSETIIAHYGNRAGNTTKLELAPYGFVIGSRRYLVAYPVENGKQRVPLRYRIETLSNIEFSGEVFIRDKEFDLAEFSSWAFGSYYHDDEYDEVIWKFSGKAAERAANFCFHPNQEVSQSRESTIVKFWAAGWLEMTWYLYQWGDEVEVLKPDGLRKMVQAYQRSDFDALP